MKRSWASRYIANLAIGLLIMTICTALFAALFFVVWFADPHEFRRAVTTLGWRYLAAWGMLCFIIAAFAALGSTLFPPVDPFSRCGGAE